MLTRSLPRSVFCLLERFRGCFTAPTFEVFCALTVGFWAQAGAHTVTGMLMAAGLSATWHHASAPVLLHRPLVGRPARPVPARPGRWTAAGRRRTGVAGG
jgi:hypothetical protein